MLYRMRTRASIAFLAFMRLAKALDNLAVYTDNALASGWENWSWSTEVDFTASDIVAGSSGTSISAKSEPWAALSLKLSQGTFVDYAGLRFDIAVSHPLLGSRFKADMRVRETNLKFRSFSSQLQMTPPRLASLSPKSAKPLSAQLSPLH